MDLRELEEYLACRRIRLKRHERELICFSRPGEGYVTIEYAQYPENPREYYEHLSTFLTWHPGYYSPDENQYKTPQDFVEDVLGRKVADKCKSMQDVLKALSSAGFTAQGIYCHEHGEVTYSLGDTNPYCDVWDSGAVGFAFIDPEDANFITKKEAVAMMKDELGCYNAYINGDVWSVNEYDACGESTLCRVPLFYDLNTIACKYPDLEPLNVKIKVCPVM